MLPGETTDSCEVVSLGVEIWGLIPSPTCQQLLGADEEQALQSSCIVSGASPEWQPASSSGQKCPLDLCFHLPFVQAFAQRSHFVLEIVLKTNHQI